MRLLHTADWHLGQTLREWDRGVEHQAFLAWLLAQAEEHEVDALLIAGDVFDHSNPSAAAQEAWYGFLARLRTRLPNVTVVVIAGNHDSPGRLDAPAALLSGLGVHVVGAMPTSAGAVDVERLIVPVASRRGPAGQVLAVPFLRAVDLRLADDEPPDAGVARVYADCITRARARSDVPLVVMGHLFAAHGQVSQLSERRILGGDLHAVAHATFPEDIAYVALGHLHLAQRVGGRERVRYAGSPIPLSTAEGHYRHQVLLVDVAGPAEATVTPLYVPRQVDFLRVPAHGALSPRDAEAALAALPAAGDTPEHAWPFVELHVVLDAPEPSLPRRIERALEGRAARLVRVARERGGSGAGLAAKEALTLHDLSPVHVFEQLHTREHGTEPAPALRAAFDELLASVAEAAP